MCSSTWPYLDNADAVLDSVYKVRAENGFILQFDFHQVYIIMELSTMEETADWSLEIRLYQLSNSILACIIFFTEILIARVPSKESFTKKRNTNFPLTFKFDICVWVAAQCLLHSRPGFVVNLFIFLTGDIQARNTQLIIGAPVKFLILHFNQPYFNKHTSKISFYILLFKFTHEFPQQIGWLWSRWFPGQPGRAQSRGHHLHSPSGMWW